MNLIGIGKVGCNIVDVLARYDETRMVYKINVGDFGIAANKTPDYYEESFPEAQIRKYLKGVKEDDETLVVLCGANIVTAMTLRILEGLPSKNLSIFYIAPLKDQITRQQAINDKIVCNVLQHYARSGMFRAMWLVDNELVEKYVGAISVKRYFETLNDAICQTFQAVHFLLENGPLLGNNPVPLDICRMITFGVVSPDNDIVLFHDLPQVKQLHYIWAYNEKRLDEPGTILRDIKSQIANNKIPTTYGIYETNYSNDFIYVVAYTNVVKEKK